MTGTPAAVAAFDVDGTLTTSDCVRPFLERVGGRRGIAAALLRRPVVTARAAVARDRDALKEIVAGGVLRGRAVDAVDRLGAEFARHVHASWLRADVVERLRWHQGAGHATVIVSASLGPYLRPLASLLGIDAVLCTDVRHDGTTYGDRLDGGNCRAAVKAERLQAWLAGAGLGAVPLWAYGDSAGDRQLLAMAGHAVWIGRERLASPPTTDGTAGTS